MNYFVGKKKKRKKGRKLASMLYHLVFSFQADDKRPVDKDSFFFFFFSAYDRKMYFLTFKKNGSPLFCIHLSSTKIDSWTAASSAWPKCFSWFLVFNETTQINSAYVCKERSTFLNYCLFNLCAGSRYRKVITNNRRINDV